MIDAFTSSSVRVLHMTEFAGDHPSILLAHVFRLLSSLTPMSEYWVSKKRYFCKYCDTYIADDVPSRQHHENGLRHKGNVERFVRGLYKAGEKRKKDADEEKREMRRIEQVQSYYFLHCICLILSLQRLPMQRSHKTSGRVEPNTQPRRVPLPRLRPQARNPKIPAGFWTTLLQSHLDTRTQT